MGRHHRANKSEDLPTTYVNSAFEEKASDKTTPLSLWEAYGVCRTLLLLKEGTGEVQPFDIRHTAFLYPSTSALHHIWQAIGRKKIIY